MAAMRIKPREQASAANWRDPVSLDVWLQVAVDTGGPTLFEANITHNLNKMAEAAGIYNQLWRPEEIGIYEAAYLIKPLEEGLSLLLSNPEYFKTFDAPNKWGVYDDFVPWIERYLDACRKHPAAHVHVSR